MTYYRPCKSCSVDRAACARRAEIKAGLARLGVTAVSFICRDRQPLFRIGQRVSVTFEVPSEWGGDLETWPATIIAESLPKYTIRVDNVNSDFDTPADEYFNQRRYCRVSVLKLSPIPEPDRKICKHCGAPEGNHDEDCDDGMRNA